MEISELDKAEIEKHLKKNGYLLSIRGSVFQLKKNSSLKKLTDTQIKRLAGRISEIKSIVARYLPSQIKKYLLETGEAIVNPSDNALINATLKAEYQSSQLDLTLNPEKIIDDFLSKNKYTGVNGKLYNRKMEEVSLDQIYNLANNIKANKCLPKETKLLNIIEYICKKFDLLVTAEEVNSEHAEHARNERVRVQARKERNKCKVPIAPPFPLPSPSPEQAKQNRLLRKLARNMQRFETSLNPRPTKKPRRQQ